MKFRLPLVLALGALLCGCSTSPTGRKQLMMVSDGDMSKMGLAAFNDMRTKGKFADAPKERAYATCVANALVAVLPAPPGAGTVVVHVAVLPPAAMFSVPVAAAGWWNCAEPLTDRLSTWAISPLGPEPVPVV